jgi:hypothetical protein
MKRHVNEFRDFSFQRTAFVDGKRQTFWQILTTARRCGFPALLHAVNRQPLSSVRLAKRTLIRVSLTSSPAS